MDKLEAFIKQAIDHHVQSCFVVDAETDILVYANKAMVSCFSIPEELLKNGECVFEKILSRPKRWQLLKKDIKHSGESGLPLTSDIDFKSLADEEPIACQCKFTCSIFEGKTYFFGAIQLVDTQVNQKNAFAGQSTHQQINGLMKQNMMLLRDISFQKYIYTIIHDIQTMGNVDGVLNHVCKRLVERGSNNEFGVEKVAIYILKSDKINRSYYTTTSENDVACHLEGEVESFLRNAKTGQEHRDGAGGILIAMNLFDVDAVDSVFLVKLHNEESLSKDLAELKVVLNSTARQVSNVYLTDRLRKESIEDPLTGAFNRRYFDKNVKDEVSRAGRYGRPLSLIFLDIDFFKKVNDVYGHSQGDECLRQTVATCSESGRGSDHLYRYGGEEFVLLLPETNHEQAMIRAEKIRELIQNHPFDNLADPSKPLKVTVSLGVTEYKDGQSIKDFINSADESLYQAKSSGRNKVVGSK